MIMNQSLNRNDRIENDNPLPTEKIMFKLCVFTYSGLCSVMDTTDSTCKWSVVEDFGLRVPSEVLDYTPFFYF